MRCYARGLKNKTKNYPELFRFQDLNLVLDGRESLFVGVLYQGGISTYLAANNRRGNKQTEIR